MTFPLQVEMFVLSTPEQSDALHQELIDLEIEMFSELGLHFKVRDHHLRQSTRWAMGNQMRAEG